MGTSERATREKIDELREGERKGGSKAERYSTLTTRNCPGIFLYILEELLRNEHNIFLREGKGEGPMSSNLTLRQNIPNYEI